MTPEELNEINERHHKEMKELFDERIDKLEEKLSKIPIVIKQGSKPVEYERNDFHQETYDSLHFKGIGGKTFKFFMFSFYLIQIIIAIKIIFK